VWAQSDQKAWFLRSLGAKLLQWWNVVA